MSDLETLDMRRAAIHEAAHLVVLLALGGAGSARIFPSGTKNSVEEKLWIGQMTPHAPANTWTEFMGVECVRYDRAREVWHMAGTAAELWMAGIDTAEMLFEELSAADEMGDFSVSDRTGFDEVLFEDAEVMTSIFSKYWPQIEAEADALCRHAASYNTTEGQLMTKNTNGLTPVTHLEAMARINDKLAEEGLKVTEDSTGFSLCDESGKVHAAIACLDSLAIDEGVLTDAEFLAWPEELAKAA